MVKLYTVDTPKVIIGMYDIQGPLTTPSKMEFANVLEMVRRGYKIYQVNPYDYNEKVRVTVSNINSIKFKTTRAANVAQRKLNQEIQDMDKPMMVDVVSKDKETTENIKSTEKDHGKNNKHNEGKNVNKLPEGEKITTPDNFKA